MLMLGPDTHVDSTSLSVEAKGTYKNFIFKPHLVSIDDTFESEFDTKSVESV